MTEIEGIKELVQKRLNDFKLLGIKHEDILLIESHLIGAFIDGMIEATKYATERIRTPSK